MKHTRRSGAGATHRAPGEKGKASMTQTDAIRSCSPELAAAARRRRSPARPAPNFRRRSPSASSASTPTLDDLLYDYSKQRIDAAALRPAAPARAQAADVEAKRDAMFRGDLVNSTERRAALHSALRNFSGEPVLVEGANVMPEVERERARDARLRRRRARGPPARRARPADDRRRQYRHRRLRPRPGDGDAGARALRRGRICARISSPTSTAPTSPTRCTGSIPRARCSSSPPRPSRPRRR